MKELVVLAALISLGSPRLTACGGASFPGWPIAYSVRGSVNIPYAELREPFMAYYDGTVGSSRVDYYGDALKIYQISTMGAYGSMMQLAPVTTDSQLNNVNTCLQRNGTVDDKVTPQPALPSLDGFQCVGKEIIDGVKAQKYVNYVKNGEKISKYAMWVTTKKNNKFGSEGEPVPLHYEMKGLLGSHYDHYYLSYDLYSSDAPSPSVWELEANMTCTVVPGLEMESVASFNPMKQFIHNKL